MKDNLCIMLVSLEYARKIEENSKISISKGGQETQIHPCWKCFPRLCPSRFSISSYAFFCSIHPCSFMESLRWIYFKYETSNWKEKQKRERGLAAIQTSLPRLLQAGVLQRHFQPARNQEKHKVQTIVWIAKCTRDGCLRSLIIIRNIISRLLIWPLFLAVCDICIRSGRRVILRFSLLFSYVTRETAIEKKLLYL